MSDNYIDLPVEGGSGGVTSLNGLVGALTLVAGSGITITPLGTNITIAATGAGFVPTSRTISTTAPLQGGGDLSTNRTLSITQSSTSTDGYLSATDWNTFNNKQDALTLPLSIANGGTGQITKAAAFDALSPMTTGGDLIYGGASGTGTRLANGNAGEVLSSNGTTLAPSWVTKVSLGAVTPTGSTLAARSGSGNLAANIFVPSIASTVTAGGTTTLLVSSAGTQVFTGSSTQTCQLPANNTMTVGSQFQIKNRSSGVVTITSSGGNTVKAMAANSSVILTLTTAVADPSAAPWDVCYNEDGSTPVTSVSVASANGFAGSSSGGTTPALTLSTTITGVLKGDATAISAATAGTDYSAGTSALATGILKSTTTTGALSIAVAGDFPTLNQNTTGTASNVTGIVALANGGTAANLTATAGAVPYSTSSALALSGVGTTGQALISGGTGSPTWVTTPLPTIAGPSTLRRMLIINEDWTTGAVAGSYGWTATTSTGTVVMNTANVDGTHWGVVTLTSGTANTNAALISTGAAARVGIGTATVYVEMYINLSRLGVASTDDYTFRAGLFDNWTGLPNNGVWFDYNVTGNATGANWYRSTANGGSRSQVNSTVAVATGWHKLGIKIIGTTSAEFFVDDVSIGTNSGASMPSNTTMFMGIGILKNANGSTNTTCLVDWYSLYALWSSDR